MPIRWEGTDRLERLLIYGLPDTAVDELGAALFREGEQIMTRSQRDFVPVDLGTLRASGHVKPPEIRGTRASVTLGYGGAASAYALVQHERMDFQHTVGGPKYLERPVNEAAKGLGNRLARSLDLEP